MQGPTFRHDAVGGSAVVVWLGGMGLVLGQEEPLLIAAGGGMWAVGLLAAAGVAAHAYRVRMRRAD